MKIILDNGHIMHYNNHCSAGVAHLVERDLAKVEVASSSLVARSKITPSDRVVFFCICRPGRGSNRARAKREKHAGGMFWCPRACGGPAGPPASLVARSKKKHHPSGWCFFAFTGPPAMCSPSCRQHKSVVFLRRFCLARKMEQGNAISLFVVLFLFPYNRCANGCTAADKQQGNPQSRAACVAGLG